MLNYNVVYDKTHACWHGKKQFTYDLKTELRRNSECRYHWAPSAQVCVVFI